MLVQVHALYPKGHPDEGSADVEDDNEGWRCVDVDGSQDVYSLEDLPVDFIRSNKLEPRDSANAYLTISSATKIQLQEPPTARNAKGLFARSFDTTANTTTTFANDRIKVEPGAVVSVSRAPHEDSPQALKHRRRLANGGAGNPTGAHSLLVVRVTDQNGNAPAKSRSELATDIFSDANNLVRSTNSTYLLSRFVGTHILSQFHTQRSQYRACSGRRLDFKPAVGSNIVNGVMELKLTTKTVSGQSSSTVENWVNEQLDSMGLGTKYTHTMLVLPGNVNFGGAAAYAYVGEYSFAVRFVAVEPSTHNHLFLTYTTTGWGKAVFWDGYASTLLVLVHEFGHNLRQVS